jgi:universal stress protein E
MMSFFTNILVGVDLSKCRSFTVAELSAGATETIQTAIGLACSGQARLLFFAVLNLTEEALHHLDPEDRSQVKRTVEQEARQALDDLVEQARLQDVNARSKLVLGKVWLEIIRQVLLEKHDLVVLGTRDLTGFRRLLFGNTALKLVRRCPCPVWVCKPGRKSTHPNILVATNLKPGSETVLQYGIGLARMLEAKLHVLHVVDYPLDRLGWSGLPDELTTQYHQRVRSAAEATLRLQLEKTSYQAMGENCQVHLADGVGFPDVAIQHYLELHKIDLLIMGTMAGGGFFIGNTAERLLPEVQCSVLAIKPPGFQSAVALS